MAVPALCCALAGVLAARLPVLYTAGAVAVVAGALLARRNPGILAGLLVLLLLDGLPLVSMNQSSREAGANMLGDLVFLVLVALLAGSALLQRAPRRDPLTTAAFAWGGAYLGWWSFKVLIQSPGVPVLAAVSFGRDFMYFALLLPLALAALRRREHLAGFAITLAVGAGLYALGLIAAQIAHAEVGWLVHAEKTESFEGLPRVYAPMNDLLIAAFPMALAAALIGPRRWRHPCALLALLAAVGNLLTFTRAVYVSELFAVVLISAVWAARSRRVRRALAALALAIAAAVLLSGASPSAQQRSSSPVQAVLSRIELAVSNTEEQNGTVGVRLRQTDRELQVLGSHWLTGLGFLAPAYHYFWGLREGSIRDDDLGSLNIVMTMGLIGLLLAYLPPLAGLAYLLKRRRGHVQYGGAMYLTAALVGSVTLGTISSVSGLLVLGSALALCLSFTASEAASPAPAARQRARRDSSRTAGGAPLVAALIPPPVSDVSHA